MKVSKGFKQTEIGEIPEDWEVMKLSQITTLLTNGFVGTAKTHYSDNDDDILYLQGYNVLENNFNLNGVKYVTKSFHNQHLKSSLLEGDLLTIQTGDVGLTTIVPKSLEGSNCHALIITRYRKNLANSHFVSYYINSRTGRGRLSLIETGSTMKHLNCGDMLEFEIPLPPLKEQQAIAEVLSDMDRMISQTEALIEKKKAIKQGMMQELLKPKEGWVKKKLGDVCELVNGYAFKSNDYSSFGRYSIVTISNVQDGFLSTNEFSYIDEIPNDIQRHQILEGGDILISLTGNVGRVCRVSIDNGLLNQRVGKAIPRSINADFLFVLLVNSNFRKLMIQSAVGGAQGNIGKDSINDFEFYLPNDNKEILSISVVSNSLKNEIALLESKLQKLKLQKQGMMQVLLTGRIRLT